MWGNVRLNDKKAVYRLIECSDADVNCTNGRPLFSTSLTLGKVMILHERSKSTLHRSMSCISEDSAQKLCTSTFSSPSSSSDEQMEVDECLDGCFLLHVACQTADVGMIELLLQQGTKINSTDLKDKRNCTILLFYFFPGDI